MDVTEDELARFWAKVDKRGQNECWPWISSNDGRYGVFYLRGRSYKANRMSLALATGEALDNPKLACHSCDNPICVNPNHLWWGTMRDNVLDSISKGRFHRAKEQPHNHNRVRTHCKRGHALDGENLIMRKNGKRLCRTCQRNNQRRHAQQPDIAAKRAAYQRSLRANRAALKEPKHEG